MNTQTGAQDTVKFYDHIFQITVIGWIIVTCVLWIFFINIPALQEKTTSKQRQASGTPYIDFAHYEISASDGGLTEVQGYRRYWIEYYTQTEDAKWYADSMVMLILTGIIFLAVYFLVGYMDKRSKNPLLLRFIFWALLFLPAGHLVCKAEFLLWASRQ